MTAYFGAGRSARCRGWIAAVALFACAGQVQAAPIAGTASVSGKVTAPKPFVGAQVHLMNTDKNVLFMVYTSGGRYNAVNLFPGSYEVTVVKRGFVSDKKTLSLKAGTPATLDLELKEGSAPPPAPSTFGGMGGGQAATPPQRVSYDELYPPEPARALVERTCIYCHGRNFIPSRNWTVNSANTALDLMMVADEKTLRQVMIPPGSLTGDERKQIVDYLATHYPPGTPRRTLRVDAEFPLDEAALAKAMYIEYYLPLDPQLDARNTQRRGQDPYFDKDGNVWYTDRSLPNRVGRLDPRTGAFKDWVLPVPDADPHGLTVDAKGQVFWAEVQGFHLGRLDPVSGEMTRYPMDSSGKNKGRGHTPIVDSKQNIWYTVIAGDMIGKWDRQTQKTQVWKIPTAGGAPYGIMMDREERNLWFAEFRACKIAKFEIATERFTEYEALTRPCLIRRMSVDLEGNAWYAGFSSGKIGRLDVKTGKITEYSMPMPFSEPYDIWPDRQGFMWVTDGGQGGASIRFDPRSEKFTYYPTPQVTDQPKMEITREGALWYNPRSSRKAAVGVLHPDVSKMTSFAAYY